MKLKVTYATPISKYVNQSFKIVEFFDLTPMANGFVPDYNLRALALGWQVVSVEEV